MDRNYKIPNMNEGLDLLGAPTASNDRMLRIIHNLNAPAASAKAMNESVEQEDKVTTTCPCCGATWTPSAEMEDGSQQTCPNCDYVFPAGDGNAQVEDEASINESDDKDEVCPVCGKKHDECTCESEKKDEDAEKLEESLNKYMECVDNGDTAGAKKILESAEANAICEAAEDGCVDVMLEKFVIKVDSEGHKTKKQIRTKKVRRTPAQKAALRKARKTANKSAAKKKRKKAMKARARMGLTESLRKARTATAVQQLAESAGFHLNSKDLERAINEAYKINEAEILMPDENIQSTLENVLRNKGIEILSSETEVVDGVIIDHLQVSDTDAEIFLGDIADEVAESLQGYDVDYDEPEEDDEDDKKIFIDFYFIPVLTAESVEQEEEVNPTEEPEGTKEVNESGDPEKNESEDCEGGKIEESFEMAGGLTNVRCKINPAFIKQGQVIFDADDQTVFTAMTESVSADNGYNLAVKVNNSAKAELSALCEGAELNLEKSGRYFLLRSNPCE